MSWLRRAPTPEKKATDEVTKKLEVVQRKRKSVIRNLIRTLDEIPLEDGIGGIGRDITRRPF